MNAKVLIVGSIITFVVLIAGLLLLTRPEPKAEVKAASTGKVTFDHNFYDFGTVSMAKGLVSHKFPITNSDSVPATVTKLYSSCMCTKGSLLVGGKTWGPFGMPGHVSIPSIAAEIFPGATGEVEVIFDPAAHGPAGVGRIDRTVTAELNGQTPLQFNFTANVTP